MTRKDFILIADALRRAREDCGRNAHAREGVDRAVDNMARKLSEGNARFDVDRFMKAAGYRT